MEKISGKALTFRVKEQGAPFFADILYGAGVVSATWSLPSCECLYLTRKGHMSLDGAPLSGSPGSVPVRESLLCQAVNRQYEGAVSFSEFLEELWRLGVTQYHVDYIRRTVTFRPVAAAPGLKWSL
ncbi:hypothetical protein ACRZTK_004407 [Enterobacter asburiae]